MDDEETTTGTPAPEAIEPEPAPEETDLEAFNRISAELDAKEKAAEQLAKAGGKGGGKKPAEPTEETEEAKETEAKADGEETEEETEKPAQRHKLEIQFRRREREIKQREQAVERAIKQAQAELANERAQIAKFTPDSVKKLIDGGDFDGFSKLFGFESFEAMNTHALKSFSDPSYKAAKDAADKIRALEQREEQRQREQDEARQRHVAAQREEEFKTFVASEVTEDEDEDIQRLAKADQWFVPSCVTEMKREYQKTRKQISPSEAAQRVLKSRRAMYDELSKIFGDQAASNQPESAPQRAVTPARAGSSKQPARPSKHVTRKGAAGTPGAPAEMSDADWVRWGKTQLEQSFDEDRRNGSL